jgi:endo-1,4-beta-xylanase
MRKLVVGICVVALVGLLGCPQPDSDPEDSFTPVSAIIDVPGTATAGTPLTLSGTVQPENATNKTIVWSVAEPGTTGASISNGNTLNVTAAGTVTVTAAIAYGLADGKDYTRNFTITVNTAHVPVSAIIDVPGTVTAGTPLTLSGTVEPENATNKTIVWSVADQGTTGASISNGNTLNTTAAGTVTVTATIANGLASGDYTRNFTITVNTALIPVSAVIDVPGTATAGIPLTLSGTVEPENATNKTIVWSVAEPGTTGASVSNGNTLNTTAAGTATITATIANGLADGEAYTQSFDIAVVEPALLSISVGFNRGIAITGSSGANIIRKNGAPSSLTLSVDDAAGYTDVAWYMNGGTTPVAITGSLVIDASAYAAQLHSLTFTGKKDGTLYSQAIPFTVFD